MIYTDDNAPETLRSPDSDMPPTAPRPIRVAHAPRKPVAWLPAISDDDGTVVLLALVAA
jgi:hypothetical protein